MLAPKTAAPEGTSALLSTDDAKPLEQGGAIARSGFNYQDQVTCALLIDTLATPEIVKVHCETHDDSVVVWQTEGTDVKVAEYVQVKSNDQNWTRSELCAIKGGKSIYETSLSRDRHHEASRFRIVTARAVAKELQFLTLPIGGTGREPTNATFTALQTYIDGKFPELKSVKGNGSVYWIGNCLWDVQESEKAVNHANLVRLAKLSQQEGRNLLFDHIETLANELLAWAKSAAAALWEPDKSKKIITRAQLRQWWEARTQQIIDGASVTSGGKLRMKLEAAGVPEDLIRLAQELRRDYSRETRTSRYMASDDLETLQSRVKSEVASLRSQMAAGMIDLNGIQFHALCIQRMDSLATGAANDVAFLKGCLYDIADRCMLRFTHAAQ